jgi:hypothetical protein
MLNVWRIKMSEEGQLEDIELIRNQRIPDHLLVGAVWGLDSCSLVVAPYDFKFLFHVANVL